MAAADLLSMLPLHQQTFDQDSEMDNFFDFNQVAPQPTHSAAQQQHQDTAFITDDFQDNQKFAGPSHQYDLFRQQTGISVGDLSHLHQPQADSFFANTGLDASWNFDLDSLTDFTGTATSAAAPAGAASASNMPAQPHLASIAEDTHEQDDEQMSNVGRLWPGMHQQQAQRAAQAKAQALALRQARASIAQQQAELISPVHDRRVPTLVPHPATQQLRQPSIAPSINDDDFPVADGFMPNGPRPSISASKKGDDEDIDEDERLLASEEGKKLSSKERRQLRNKVSARAFRSRRKEYITQLEGEINAKAQECTKLKTDNTQLTSENARYRDLIQFLIKQPSFAPVLAELNRDPAMSGVQGLSLLPPTSSLPTVSNNTTNESADPNMLNVNPFNGMPFNFQ